MMRLKTFQITNYRSCVKTSLDTEEGLTCLIGINGVGKTNLLNGIQLLKKINSSSRFIGQTANKNSGSTTSLSLVFLLEDKPIKVGCEIKYESDDRNNDEVLNASFKFNLFAFTGSRRW